MLSIILFAIVSLTQLSSDTVEVKGTSGLSYRLFANQNKLCFQYKAGRNWSEPTKLDSGDISEYQIVITTGDYLHVVWTKQGRVHYKTNIYPVIPKDTIQWERFIIISPYFTEPASNISIEIRDEFVSVSWKAPSEDEQKRIEKWCRDRWLKRTPFDWEYPECLSESVLKR